MRYADIVVATPSQGLISVNLLTRSRMMSDNERVMTFDHRNEPTGRAAHRIGRYEVNTAGLIAKAHHEIALGV